MVISSGSNNYRSIWATHSNQFRRLEGILIKLIDQQKITQMDLKQVKGYIEGIEDILSRLINGEIKK